MSDIQRYGDPSRDYMIPAHDDGFVVLYADHVAAVAAAEQRVTSDFAKYLRHMVDDDKFAAGVKAARDAVDAIPTSAFDVGIVGKDDALAAIDALEKP